MSNKILLSVLLLLAASGRLLCLDLTRQNLRYLYDPYAPVSLRHSMAFDNGNYQLYILLKLKNPLRKEHKFSIDLLAQQGYTSKHEVVLDAELKAEDSSRYRILRKYELKVPVQYGLMIVDCLVNNVHYYYDIPINSGLAFPCDKWLPMAENGWPLFDNYLKPGAQLDFGTEVFIYQYHNQFKTAIPPMAADDRQASNTIRIDTSFAASAFVSGEAGVLSFLQTDSTSNSGRSLLSVGQHYPKYRQIEDLSKPIIYLSKREEYVRLQESEHKRKAFERFWISLIPAKERARRIIKRYFEHVTQANRLFTSYKEGWRTDRGMIYIVYGYPREVRRSSDKETWTYSINGKKQSFSFAKVPNLFVQQHYVLIRDKNLVKVWNNQLGKWRKGNM